MILKRWRSERWKRSLLDTWSLQRGESNRSLERLAEALVRNSCLQGRDILVHAAIDELYDWSSLSKLLATARMNRESSRKAVSVQLKHKPAKALARVLYRQQLLDSDLLDAIDVYKILVANESQELEPVDHGYLIDALTIRGRRQEAIDYLKLYESGLRDLEAFTYLLANVLNPHSGGLGSEAEWLEQVNAPLTGRGLEPIELRAGTDQPFCRLACTAAHAVPDGPLVSVLMPVHESNDATEVAIQSLLAQSWRNLELIVVDDASTPSSRERLKKWEGRDERLRIVYNDQNRGAYCARNTGYELARGEFVTVADKDDWHHPRKIELHARDLIDQPDKLANMSSWTRVDTKLNFLVRYAPIQLAHPSQPSLFFRRIPVKEALGYWDGVRKGADGEYKLRMQRVFGIEVKPLNRIPLALSLMGRENLSSEDFGLGYEHPDRSSYKHTYNHWHRRITENADPYVPKEATHRPFPAPTAFLPTVRGAFHFDITFGWDLSADTEDSELIRTELLAGLDRGMRIAVLHLPDLMRLSRKQRPPLGWLNDLILDERVTRISFTDRADTELLVIGTPPVLQFRPERRCGISARRVFVLAKQAPFDATSTYLPRTVADNIRSMFRADALWVPFDRDVRWALRRVLRRKEISTYEWRGTEHLHRVSEGQ